VVAWFGYWPTFHDAEVLSITMNRSGESQVAIHVFETTRGVGASGRLVLTKNAVVTFFLEGFAADREGIAMNRVEFFNHQNVLSCASVNKLAEGYELRLENCYGVDARFVSLRITVQIASK